MTRALFIALIAATLWIGTSLAETFQAGDIEITHAWSRATPRGSSVGGAYLTVINHGTTPDRLVSGTTPVAKTLQLHRMAEDNGVMTMRPVEGGLEIKPGETVDLKPGGLHLMLMGLTQPLQQGHPFKATLVFEKAGKVTVDFEVLPIGATHAP